VEGWSGEIGRGEEWPVYQVLVESGVDVSNAGAPITSLAYGSGMELRRQALAIIWSYASMLGFARCRTYPLS
jgi:hypothetical protein